MRRTCRFLALTATLATTLFAGASSGVGAQNLRGARVSKAIDQTPADTVHLLVSPFQVRGDPVADFLGLSMPELLGVGFASVPEVTIRRGVPSDTANVTLRGMGIDVVLTGDIWSYTEDRVRIEGRLREVRTGETRSVSSSVIDLRGIYEGLGDFFESVRAEVRALRRSVRVARLAVVCFVERSTEASGLGEEMGFLISSSLSPEMQVVIPWGISSKFCDTQNLPEPRIAEVLGADIVISGEVTIEDGELRVEPMIFSEEVDPFVRLPATRGPIETYLDIESRVVEDLEGILGIVSVGDGGVRLDSRLYGPVRSSEEYLRFGNADLEQGDPFLAALWFSRALRENPRSGVAHAQLARIRADQGRTDEAAQWYGSAMELDPGDSRLPAELGLLYLDAGDWEQAARFLGQALDMGSDNEAELQLLLGEALYDANRLDDALTVFQAAVLADPTSVDAYVALGRARRDRGEEDAAITVLETALALEPTSPIVRSTLSALYAVRGAQYQAANQSEQAVEAYEQAVELQPSADLYSRLTYSLNLLEDYEEVVQIAGEAEAQGFGESSLFNEAGVAQFELEEFEEALEWLDKATRADPRNDIAHSNRGATLYNLTRWPESREAFETAIEIRPTTPRYHLDHAFALAQLGLFEEGLADSDRALELDGGVPRSHSTRAFFLTHLDRFEDAVEAADAALRLTPEYYFPMNHKGFSLYWLGEKEEGLRLIERSIELSTDYGGTHFNLARISAREGDMARVLFHLRDAFRIQQRYIDRSQFVPEFDVFAEEIRRLALDFTSD